MTTSAGDDACKILELAASVYHVPAAEVANLQVLIRGTYRILEQLRIEERVSDMFDLPPSWVVSRWLVSRGYDASDFLGLVGIGAYEQVWHECRARFPRYGIGQPPVVEPDDGLEPTAKKRCPCLGGCVVS